MSSQPIIARASRLGRHTAVWLCLSLAVSAYYAGEGLRQGFSGPYVVQDDVRQHVFWMARFGGSRLLTSDLAADYFQAMAPPGYTALYWLGATFGIDPLVLNKLLPLPLGLITTAFCFALCLQLVRAPVAALVSALLLNQSLWMQDDLISATPRAFFYPLLLAFLYYTCRRKWPQALTVLAIQGLFYPPVAFISIVVLGLRLITWRGARPALTRDRLDYVAAGAGLAVFAVVIGAYALKSSGFGPVVTASEARLMPEFSASGRMRVFHTGFWEFWISGQNSGMVPVSSLMPFTICASLLLPVLIRYPGRFPLTRRLSPNIKILGQLALASVMLFFAAHAALFRLYLPSRYTQHSLRVLLSVGAGITLTAMVEAAFRSFDERVLAPGLFGKLAGSALLTIIAATLILYPGRPQGFMQTRYRQGRQPQLYDFFARQPKEIVVASLSKEADRIPVFSKRTNLVSWECSIPFHKGYYSQMRQRTIELIDAQYSPDLSELQRFIREYQVAFLMVDRAAFNPDYLATDKWLKLYQPAASGATSRLKQGVQPAAARLMNRCAAFETEHQVVLDCRCVLESAAP